MMDLPVQHTTNPAAPSPSVHRRSWRPTLVGSSLSLLSLLAFAAGALTGGFWGTAETARATHCGTPNQVRKYVAQLSDEAAYGVDGYIGYTNGSLIYPDCNKIAAFLDVRRVITDPSTWVQVGVRVGLLTQNPHVYNAVYTVYSEEQSACNYFRALHASPTSTNKPYYVSYDGNTASRCSATYYEYAIRRDSWSTPSRTVPCCCQLRPGRTGNVTFGNPASSLGNGMSWYNQPIDTWSEWDAATGATWFHNYPASPPLRYCPNVQYRAFTAAWSVC